MRPGGDGHCLCWNLVNPLEEGDSLPDHVCEEIARSTCEDWVYAQCGGRWEMTEPSDESDWRGTMRAVLGGLTVVLSMEGSTLEWPMVILESDCKLAVVIRQWVDEAHTPGAEKRRQTLATQWGTGPTWAALIRRVHAKLEHPLSPSGECLLRGWPQEPPIDRLIAIKSALEQCGHPPTWTNARWVFSRIYPEDFLSLIDPGAKDHWFVHNRSAFGTSADPLPALAIQVTSFCLCYGKASAQEIERDGGDVIWHRVEGVGGTDIAGSGGLLERAGTIVTKHREWWLEQLNHRSGRPLKEDELARNVERSLRGEMLRKNVHAAYQKEMEEKHKLSKDYTLSSEIDPDLRARWQREVNRRLRAAKKRRDGESR